MSFNCRFQNTSRTVRYDSHENFKVGLEDCQLIKILQILQMACAQP